MFARVLFPTDLSAYADAVLACLPDWKAAGLREVILRHVQDERVMKLRSPEQLAEFNRQDTERLDAFCKSLSLFGLQVRPLLKPGIPFKEALSVADEMDVSLIVLGSQGVEDGR